MSRFVVGIDLGTTNCALAYADTGELDQGIRMFEIAQVVAPGESMALKTLPSFLLLPTESEVASKAMALPWSESESFCVGTMARTRGAELPHRLVSSAKSWLSHSAADPSEAILPWRAQDESYESGEMISPLSASARYLEHLRLAWDETHPDAPLAEQEVFVTVPASFDAAARELTAAAATKAGLPKVTLMEEPQAAFYAWLSARGDAWRGDLQPGDVALVCDIGGGTSDFSLIAAEDDGAGNLELERVAVGEHILLGGDNMDLALAHLVTSKLGEKGKTLKMSQRQALIQSCRQAKEDLLGDASRDAVTINILGSGSKLIGGTLKAELTASDLDLLVNGFLPKVQSESAPARKKQMGLREMGLPYAQDPAITKHLAAFIQKHGKEPTKVLFNGGVMGSPKLRERIAENLNNWFGRVTPLEGTHLDLAVAHGAAYYGLVRQGKGIRIRGGTARSYYIGIESSMPAIPGFEAPIKAMCIAPAGMEEGTHEDLPDEELGFVVGEATTFRLFSATHRPQDQSGALVDPDEAGLREIAPIRTELDPTEDTKAGDLVPVYLAAHVTEVGTLELYGYAKDGDTRWRLEYSIRAEDDIH